ncbi:MAG TPA: hypothetical protein VFQ45_12985, partial [Longimicrobium sp.]|nr:hypothetical protein [Longimicrobium sp.]
MRRVSLLLAATLLAACDGATHPAPRCELKITTPRLVNETVPPETPVVLAADVVASDLPAGARVEWTWGGRTITGNPVTTELSQGQSRFTATLRGPDGAVLARDTATLRNPFDSLAVAMEPCTRHLLRGESMPPGCLRAAVTANPRGYPYVVTWRLNGGQGVRDPAALPIAALPAGTHYLFVDAAVSGRTTAATVMSTLTVHDTTVVAGRAWAVTPAGAAAPAGPLRVFAKVGEVMDSTDVAGDGTFSLRSRGALGDS